MFSNMDSLNSLVSKSILVDLRIPTLPASFQLPKEQSEIEKFATLNPNVQFITKNNIMRGIQFSKSFA